MPSCVTTAGSMSAAIMMERECRPWLIRAGLVSRAMAMRPSGNRESSCISGAEGIKREPREGGGDLSEAGSGSSRLHLEKLNVTKFRLPLLA